MDLVEPHYWLTHHGRALRTVVRRLHPKLGYPSPLPHKYAVQLATMSWSRPDHSARDLITVLMSRYGK